MVRVGNEGAVVRDIENAVAIRIWIARIANAVSVHVLLVSVSAPRAVIQNVRNTVAVSVAVGSVHCVARVTEAVLIEICLVVVGRFRAVVTCVT